MRGVLAEPGALRDASELLLHGIPAEDLPAGRDVVAVFPPAGVAVYRDRPHGSPRNSVRVRIAALEVNGAVVRVRAGEQGDGTAGLAADITPDAMVDLGLQVGEAVWFTVKTQAVGLYPGAGHT